MGVTEAAESFRQAAREYCAFIDSATAPATPEFFNQLAACLNELQRRAWELPDVEVPDEFHWGEGNPEAVQALFTRLEQVLGDRNGYWMVHDPTNATDHEPVWASLCDDLADIYSDLRDGLEDWESGLGLLAAVWRWRTTAWSHWGCHLVDGLRTIHYIQERNHSDQQAAHDI